MQLDRKIWDEFTRNNDIIGKENCPFCDLKKGEIIKNFKYWVIIKNKYPYNGDQDHLLLIPKKHKEITSKLTIEELKELKKIHIFMNEFYGGKNYFSFIRETNGGKSIGHLHYHYIPGRLSSGDLENIIKK